MKKRRSRRKKYRSKTLANPAWVAFVSALLITLTAGGIFIAISVNRQRGSSVSLMEEMVTIPATRLPYAEKIQNYDAGIGSAAIEDLTAEELAEGAAADSDMSADESEFSESMDSAVGEQQDAGYWERNISTTLFRL